MTIQTTIDGIQTELIDFQKLKKPVTAEIVDAIVTNCLRLLDMSDYRFERQSSSEDFVYAVYKSNALLGRFRIWRRDDTSIPLRYGIYQHSDTPDLEREWQEMVYGFIYVDIARRVELLSETQRDNSRKIAIALLDVWDEWAFQAESAEQRGYMKRPIPNRDTDPEGFKKFWSTAVPVLEEVATLGEALTKLTDAVEESWEFLDRTDGNDQITLADQEIRTMLRKRAIRPDILKRREDIRKALLDDGLTRREAAERTGIPDSTIKSDLRAMKINLRKLR